MMTCTECRSRASWRWVVCKPPCSSVTVASVVVGCFGQDGAELQVELALPRLLSCPGCRAAQAVVNHWGVHGMGPAPSFLNSQISAIYVQQLWQ